MVFLLHGCSTGKWNGAVVNVTSQTATSEDFDITGSIPTSAFQVDLTVQAGKNVSIGDHPVTLTGISIQTSKGEGYGNTDTEDFDVEKLAVDISGPPYVIIDNSTLYDNSPVDSTYTASVQGAPDPLNMAYEWTVSPNINNLSTLSGAPNTLPVDGAGPEGAGNITCVAYSNGTNQSGSKQVTVQDEYVVTEDPGQPTNIDEGHYIGAFGGSGNPANAPGPVTWNALVGQTKKGSYSVSAGFTTGISIGVEDIAEAKFGFSTSTTFTGSYSITFNSSFSVSIPPGDSVVVQGWLIYDQYTGTYQIWGTGGMLQHGNWVYTEPDPGVGGLSPIYAPLVWGTD